MSNQITIKRATNGFVIEGHSNYAEYGKDIICSAVSALAQTALAGLIKYSKVDYQIKEGYLKVDVKEPNLHSRIIIDTIFLGLKGIADMYPKHVQIKEEKKCLK
jgi:uncharacterized protein YsxB (DUF464 family)